MTLLRESGTPGLAVIDGVDVDAVAAAVSGCEGVAALDGGPFGEVASYLPGRRVAGVMAGNGRVAVQVRSRWGIPAADLAARITDVLAPLTGHRPVDVVIADIDDPPATLPFRMPAESPLPDPDPGLPPV
jgi:hypothetical protein